MPYFLAPLWKTNITALSEEELWDHYAKCLGAYDWTYMMSDDHGVWQAGEEQRSHLDAVLTEAKKHDEDRAISMYTDASPWDDIEGADA